MKMVSDVIIQTFSLISVIWGLFWPLLVNLGPKLSIVYIVRNDIDVLKVTSKPYPSDFCSSCNHFEVSQDQFATILCSGPKMALSGPKMTQNGLK